eukprot:scaffold100591_cov30-Cyclotella_meneghiniana.AAC.1
MFKALSDLPSNFHITEQNRDVEYILSAAIFWNGSHFRTISLDILFGGDENLLYDGLGNVNHASKSKRVAYVGYNEKFSDMMGMRDYFVVQLWFMKKHPPPKKLVDLNDLLKILPDPGEQSFSKQDSWIFGKADKDEFIEHCKKRRMSMIKKQECIWEGIDGNGAIWDELKKTPPLLLSYFEDRGDMHTEFFIEWLDQVHIILQFPIQMINWMLMRGNLWSADIMQTALFLMKSAYEKAGNIYIHGEILPVQYESKPDGQLGRIEQCLCFSIPTETCNVALYWVNTKGPDHYSLIMFEFGKEDWLAHVTIGQSYGCFSLEDQRRVLELLANQIDVNIQIIFDKGLRRKTMSPGLEDRKSKCWFVSSDIWDNSFDDDDGVSCGAEVILKSVEVLDHSNLLDATDTVSITSSAKHKATRILMKMLSGYLSRNNPTKSDHLYNESVKFDLNKACFQELHDKKFSLGQLNERTLNLPYSEFCNLADIVLCPCGRRVGTGDTYVQCYSCLGIYHGKCIMNTWAKAKMSPSNPLCCYHCDKQVSEDNPMIMMPSKYVPPKNQSKRCSQANIVLDFFNEAYDEKVYNAFMEVANQELQFCELTSEVYEDLKSKPQSKNQNNKRTGDQDSSKLGNQSKKPKSNMFELKLKENGLTDESIISISRLISKKAKKQDWLQLYQTICKTAPPSSFTIDNIIKFLKRRNDVTFPSNDKIQWYDIPSPNNLREEWKRIAPSKVSKSTLQEICKRYHPDLDVLTIDKSDLVWIVKGLVHLSFQSDDCHIDSKMSGAKKKGASEPKFAINTRVLIKNQGNSIGSLIHGKIVETKTDEYVVQFDDECGIMYYDIFDESEIQDMLTPVVIGLGGVRFVPYKGQCVQSYRSNRFDLQIAHVSDPGVNGARIQFEEDDEMTQVLVPYNMMKPSDLSEVEIFTTIHDETTSSHFNKIANDGSYFQPHKNSKFLVLLPESPGEAVVGTIISDDMGEWAMVKLQDGTQHPINYDRMLPILTPRLNRPKRKAEKPDWYNFDKSDKMKASLGKKEVSSKKSKQMSKASEIKNLLPKTIRRKIDQRGRSYSSTVIKATDVITNDYDEFLQHKLNKLNERRANSTVVLYRNGEISYNSLSDVKVDSAMHESVIKDFPLFARMTTVMKSLLNDGEWNPQVTNPSLSIDSDTCVFGYCHMGDCIDMGPKMDLKLANFGLMSCYLLFVPWAFFQAKATKLICLKLHNSYDGDGVGVGCKACEMNKRDNKCVLMLVHGYPTQDEDLMHMAWDAGHMEFYQHFTPICIVTFQLTKASEKLGLSYSMFEKDDQYSNCGCIKEYLFSVAKIIAGSDITDSFEVIPSANSAYAMVNKWCSSTYSAINEDNSKHENEDNSKHESSSDRQEGLLLEVLHSVFSDSSIIQKCPIESARGGVCISIRNILKQCIRHHQLKRKCFDDIHCYSNLQYICSRRMIVYQEEGRSGFLIGCEVCKKPCQPQSVEAYPTLDLALHAIQFVAVSHRLMHLTSKEFFSENFTYEDNFLPCTPNSEEYNSCLGDDQLVASVIEGELNQYEKFWEVIWHDICFVDGECGEAIKSFSDRYYQVLEKGMDFVHDYFPHVQPVEHLVLENIGLKVDGKQWDGEDGLNEQQLMQNLEMLMKIDWRHDSFDGLCPQPYGSFQKSDMDALMEVLQDPTNDFKSFHQLGFLPDYVQHAKKNTKGKVDKLWDMYMRFPKISHQYAFEKSNLCRDVFSNKGRKQRLPSSIMFVAMSQFTCEKGNDDWLTMMTSHPAFEVAIEPDANHIITARIMWIVSEELLSYLMSKLHCCLQLTNSYEHGQWKHVSKLLKQEMTKHLKGKVTEYVPVSFITASLEPFQTHVKTTDMDGSMSKKIETLGFAQTQVAVGNACSYNSIKYQQAMEWLTSASHSKVGLHRHTEKKSCESSEQHKIQYNWQYAYKLSGMACAPNTPKTHIPITVIEEWPGCINVVVDTSKWNCQVGNIANLLSCIGHLDDTMTKKLIGMDAMAENSLVTFFHTMKQCGYNVLHFQGMTSESLLNMLTEICLPAIVSVKLPMGHCTLGHVFGVCPYRKPNGKIDMALIDGSNEAMKPLVLSRTNLNWCVSEVDLAVLDFKGIVFFPGDKRSRKIKHNYLEEECWKHATVCLQMKEHKHVHDLSLVELYKKNIVLGDLSFYQTILKKHIH